MCDPKRTCRSNFAAAAWRLGGVVLGMLALPAACPALAQPSQPCSGLGGHSATIIAKDGSALRLQGAP